MPRLFNWKSESPPYGSVYIGRPSKWGNPYVITEQVSREEVIRKHRDMVLASPTLIAMIKEELRGKDLVCYCHPKTCHGDILLEIANA